MRLARPHRLALFSPWKKRSRNEGLIMEGKGGYCHATGGWWLAVHICSSRSAHTWACFLHQASRHGEPWRSISQDNDADLEIRGLFSQLQ